MAREIYISLNKRAKVTYINFWFQVLVRQGYKWVVIGHFRDQDAACSCAVYA